MISRLSPVYWKASQIMSRPTTLATSAKRMHAIACSNILMSPHWKALAAHTYRWQCGPLALSWPTYRTPRRACCNSSTGLETYFTNSFMTLDPYTRRNLELFETGRGGSVKGSLLWVLDHTRTPMGGRLLRRWISQPLLDISILQQRQQAISELLNDTLAASPPLGRLKRAGDLERLINRVRQRIATPRDLVALATGLHTAAEVTRQPLSR